MQHNAHAKLCNLGRIAKLLAVVSNRNCYDRLAKLNRLRQRHMSTSEHQKIAHGKYLVSDRAPPVVPACTADLSRFAFTSWVPFGDHELDLGVEFLGYLKGNFDERRPGLGRAAHVYEHCGQGPVKP